MSERIELTRREAPYAALDSSHYLYAGREAPNRYRGQRPYEYTLRVGENYSRVVEDWHMMEMRLSLSEAEYNRYLIERLTAQMLHHIGGTIKSALNAQAAANAPARDNMAYLFKQ